MKSYFKLKEKKQKIIREYVLPNDKTEKVNGWEYELYGMKK